jgi:hypothetical protein
MTRTVWSRASAILLLLLFLTPAVFAASRQAKHGPSELRVFAWVTEALGYFFPASLKSSGTMDPDGKPQPASPGASTTTDSRGTMDPNG